MPCGMLDLADVNNISIMYDPPSPAGPQGPPGPQGPAGPTGSQNNNAIVVDVDYQAENPTDYYIGVDSKVPVTVTLPVNPASGYTIVVKAEMAAPLGNRKVTVVTADDSLIDGVTSYVLKTHYEYVRVLFRGGNWHVIGRYT
jgi:hypothetical protein